MRFIVNALLGFGFLCGCQGTNGSLTAGGSAGVIDGTQITERTTVASRSVVLIELVNSSGMGISFCTGTLVGPQSVLTAGHCFDKHVVPGLAGFNIQFTNHYNAFGPRVSRTGLAHVTHPQYNSHTGYYDHDIALAHFKGTIPQGFAPAEMDRDINANYSGKTVYVYGFGRTEDYSGRHGEDLRRTAGDLHRGALTVIDYDLYPDHYLVSAESTNHVCQGDSGGPQFYHESSTPKIVGVNSAAYGDVLPNGMESCLGKSQATKVAPFYNWIKTQEQSLSRAFASETTTEFLETSLER